MEIRIKKGKPVPDRRGTVPRKYPLDKMNKGDSFDIPFDKGARNRIYSSVSFFTRKHPDTQFKIIQDKFNEIITVWRTK